MINAHEDTPVVAIAVVGDQTLTPTSEAAMSVIFHDDKLINNSNLDLLITTYIR